MAEAGSLKSTAPARPRMPKTETVTLGGGCFWCIEAAFNQVDGVLSAVSGYAGGHAKDPTYEEVCSGTTGHAEVVQVTFDTGKLSFRDILEMFYTLHDPTTRDRQGADVGPQYRSVILYHDERQRDEAEAFIEELLETQVWNDPIVTEVVPLPKFYPAEEHHQRYFEKNPAQGYCMAVIRPKLQKFRNKWATRLKQTATAGPPGRA